MALKMPDFHEYCRHCRRLVTTYSAGPLVALDEHKGRDGKYCPGSLEQVSPDQPDTKP